MNENIHSRHDLYDICTGQWLRAYGSNILKIMNGKRLLTPDMEIVVYPGILVPRKYLSWQKIFGKMLALNCKIDNNVR